MTGNVSALSDRMAGGQWSSGVFYLTIIGCFVAGASAAALLINAGIRRRVRGVYAWNIILESALMGLLALFEWGGEHRNFDPWLVLGLSFLMGLQNAVVTRITDARVRSTHVSGMATDIGIELAMLIDVARGREPITEAPLNWSRLRLHFQTIAAFFAGGTLGVLLYKVVPEGLLSIASVLLMGIGLKGLLRGQNKQPP